MSTSASYAQNSGTLPLSERELKAFIDATLCFFEKVTQEPAEIGEATIHIDRPPIFDFTGLIRISGSCSGFVYVTLPKKMLARMLESIGEPNANDEACLDFAGEIANTISSNAREIFGSTFHISTPAPLDTESARGLVCPCSSFVLPVVWRESEGCIVIALQQN